MKMASMPCCRTNSRKRFRSFTIFHMNNQQRKKPTERPAARILPADHESAVQLWADYRNDAGGYCGHSRYEPGSDYKRADGIVQHGNYSHKPGKIDCNESPSLGISLYRRNNIAFPGYFFIICIVLYSVCFY